MPANASDNASLQAAWEGVEEARAEMEREWGAGRLALITEPGLWAKFRRQQVRWSDLYRAAWAADDEAGKPGHTGAPKVLTRAMLDEVAASAAAMRRAYAAVTAAATEAGHRPIAPWVWETTLEDGSVLAVVQTDDDAAKVITDGRHVRVATLREMANIWDALPKALQVAKVEFPGAKFVGSGDRSWLRDGDAIPF